jgi:hypothetical protein
MVKRYVENYTYFSILFCMIVKESTVFFIALTFVHEMTKYFLS